MCSVSLSSFAPVSGVGVDFVYTGIDTDMVVPLCVSCTLSMLGHEYVFDTDCNSVLSRHLDLRFLIYLLFQHVCVSQHHQWLLVLCRICHSYDLICLYMFIEFEFNCVVFV